MVDYNDWASQAKRTSGITAEQNKKNAASRQASAKKSDNAVSSFFSNPLGTLFGGNKAVNDSNSVTNTPSTPSTSGTYLNQSALNKLSGQGVQDNAWHAPLTAYSETDDTTAKAPTFADYLAQAQAILGSGGTAAVDTSMFDTQAATARQNAGIGDAKLKSMYDQLQKDFASDGTKLQGTYQTTGKKIAADSDAGSAAVKEGYNASTAALSKQLKNLGIEDALKVAVNNGTTLQGDQAGALANVAQNKTANVNNNTTKAQAANEYSTDITRAAGSEGAAQRASNQLALQNALSDIAASKQAAQASAKSSGPSTSDYASLAQQLYENAQNEQQQGYENDISAQTLANNINKTQNSASSNSANTNSMIKLITQGAQLFPGDQTSADAWVKKQAKLLGIG